MTKRNIYFGIALALIALLFSGQSALAQQGPPPPRVEVAKVTNLPLAQEMMVPGTVVSRNASNIAAQISGAVVWVAAEGDEVATGDVIARLEDSQLTAAAIEARASVARLEADIVQKQSALERIQELADTDYAPASRLEEATAALAMAKQDLVQAKARLQRAEFNLEQATVRAPFPGHVVSRLTQLGEYANVGTPLVRLVDTQHVEVTAQSPLDNAPFLIPGMTLNVSTGQKNVAALLRTVVPVGNAVSRTMEVRLSLSPDEWVIGTAVRVGLPMSTAEQTTAVPRDALILRGNQTLVYRINAENVAEAIPVTTGRANGQFIEVRGDLSLGDNVVVRGGERLRPGQTVELISPLS